MFPGLHHIVGRVQPIGMSQLVKFTLKLEPSLIGKAPKHLLTINYDLARDLIPAWHKPCFSLGQVKEVG